MTEGRPDSEAATFALRKSKQSSKVLIKSSLEFYCILANFAKMHPLKLNLPETLIYGYSISRPTMLKTSPAQLLTVRESLTSPEYLLHSVVSMLLTCSLATRPPVPIAIYKENDGEGSDLCIPIMNLQGGQLVWNTRLAHSEPAFIQRYVYNGTPCAFTLRVTYQPTLSNYVYRIYQNVRPVARRKDQFSKSLRFACNESRATIRRKNTSVIQLETDSEDCTPSDRYCVSTSAPTTYEVSDWHEIESVKAQMSVVKTVLERGYLYAYNLELLEVVVDFCQDRDKKWYFINVHSYKTVLIVKKRITSGSLDRLLGRLFSPAGRPKSANPLQKKQHRKRRRRPKRPLTCSLHRLSLSTTMDLHQSMVEDVLRDLREHPIHSKRR